MIASWLVKYLISLTWSTPPDHSLIFDTSTLYFAEASKEILGWFLHRIRRFSLTKGNEVTVALQEIFTPRNKMNISLFSTETVIISQSTTVFCLGHNHKISIIPCLAFSTSTTYIIAKLILGSYRLNYYWLSDLTITKSVGISLLKEKKKNPNTGTKGHFSTYLVYLSRKQGTSAVER